MQEACWVRCFKAQGEGTGKGEKRTRGFRERKIKGKGRQRGSKGQEERSVTDV